MPPYAAANTCSCEFRAARSRPIGWRNWSPRRRPRWRFPAATQPRCSAARLESNALTSCDEIVPGIPHGAIRGGASRGSRSYQVWWFRRPGCSNSSSGIFPCLNLSQKLAGHCVDHRRSRRNRSGNRYQSSGRSASRGPGPLDCGGRRRALARRSRYRLNAAVGVEMRDVPRSPPLKNSISAAGCPLRRRRRRIRPRATELCLVARLTPWSRAAQQGSRHPFRPPVLRPYRIHCRALRRHRIAHAAVQRTSSPPFTSPPTCPANACHLSSAAHRPHHRTRQSSHEAARVRAPARCAYAA